MTTRRSAALRGIEAAGVGSPLGLADLHSAPPESPVLFEARSGQRCEIGRQQYVKRSAIAPNPRNDYPRLPEAELAEFAASVKAVGILHPLILRQPNPDESLPSGVDYVIVAGENRWLAAGLAALDDLPARLIIAPQIVDYDLEIEIMSIENGQRRRQMDKRKERKEYMRRRFLSEIMNSHRGGARRGGAAPEDLAERIERESGGRIPYAMARKLIPEIRREEEQRTPDPTSIAGAGHSPDEQVAKSVRSALRRLELAVNAIPRRSRKLRSELATELRRIVGSLSAGRDD